MFSSKITCNERQERLQDCSKLKETKKKLQLKEIHDHRLDTGSGKSGIIKDITELTGLKSEYELSSCRQEKCSNVVFPHLHPYAVIISLSLGDKCSSISR